MKVQEGEEILHEVGPERAVLWIWLFAKALPAGLAGGGVGFGMFGLAGLIFSFGGFSFIGGIAGAVIVGPGFLMLAMIYCEFLRRTYVYYITNQRCVFHGGIIRRIERSVHYHKVTDVEMSQNIIERILIYSHPGQAVEQVNLHYRKPR